MSNAISAAPLYAIENLQIRKASQHTAFELRVPRLAIARGERLAVVGPSGCGKSTLLDALSMIVRPQSVDRFEFTPTADAPGVDVGALLQRNAGGALAALRRRAIGYVLQTGGLLPFLSVRANIDLSRRLLGLRDDGTTEAIAEQLGIASHLRKLPAALSVGERQRVAIARALAHRPTVIIADEPTAALDPHNAAIVMQSFMDLADRFHTTTVIASHDLDRVGAAGLRRLEPLVRQVAPGLTCTEFSG